MGMRKGRVRGSSRLLAGLIGVSLAAGLLQAGAPATAWAAGNRVDVNSWAPAGGVNVASTATVTAHSNQPAWPPSMLVDGNTGTSAVNLWVANEDGVDAKGWVNLELAADADVSRVVLFPRADPPYYGVYFPAKYTVSLLDAQGEVVWSTAVTHPNSSSTASAVITEPDAVDVSPAVSARTVRIDVVERHAREGGVLQMAEIAVFTDGPIKQYIPEGTTNLARGAAVSVESSLEDASWGRQYLNDERIDTTNGWTSNSLPKVTDPAQPTWVRYDLGAMAAVKAFAVFPHNRNFPRSYRLQTSVDGTEWDDAVTSGDNPDVVAEPQVFDLAQAVGARYVRLWVDERNTVNSDDAYGYQVQLAELAVFGNPWTFSVYSPAGTTNLARDAMVSYSSSYERPNESWSAMLAKDEQFGSLSGWSTNPYDKVADPNTPAWLAYDFGCEAEVRRLVVFPREKSFPRDYRLQVSSDGASWQTVATSTGNEGTLTATQMFDLSPAVSARYVRLHADVRNGPTGVDGYLVQLSEFAAFGTQSCLLKKKPSLLMEPGATDNSWLLMRGVTETPAFRSSNDKVATVDAEGRITAVARGTTTILAETTDKSLSIEVEVREGIKRIGKDILVTGFWMMDPEYVNSEQFSTAADFGLDLLMSNENVVNLGLEGNYRAATLAAENGFWYQPADTRFGWGCGNVKNMTPDEMKAVIADYTHVPGVGSVYICDEGMPPTDYAAAFNTTAEYAPELYPHYNFLPWVDAATQRAWLEATGGVRFDWYAPDYLMFDMYPLKATIDFGSWFSNLDTTRKVGLEYKVKTATYLQTVGYGGGSPSRRPSSPEIVWEANTALAYGYKQLAYFTYWQPINRTEVFTEGIMKGDGTKSDRFDALKQLNSEIHALGPTLMKLDARDVYFNGAVNGQRPVPGTLAAPNPDGTLPAGTFLAKVDGSQDLLLSHLVDRETGEHYLFVVNNTFSGTNPAATDVTLTFDPKVVALEEVSRADGTRSRVAFGGHSVSLSLAGGEGRLYRLAIPETSALEQAIGDGNALDEDAYTTSSWRLLATALAEAEDVLVDARQGLVSQDAIDAATEALNDAITTVSLARRGDPKVLEALIRAAEAVSGNLGVYTETSAKALKAALATAKTTYADRADRTQLQLDPVVEALQRALGGLVVKAPVVDKAVLQHVYSGAKALSNTGGTYTAASWSKLQAELADAKKVLDNKSATQAQVDTAVKELSSALAGLVPKAPDTRPVVAKVKLNQSQLRLVKGKSLTLEEAVYYAGSGVRPAYAGKVTWKSSNTKVATVSSNGVVKAQKTGTVTITVTAKEANAAGRKLSTSIKVTVVKSKPKAKVTKVTASVPKTMKLGQVIYITGRYTSPKATGVKVTYSTSKPDIVLIDKVGRMVATSKGTEYVKVKAGGKTTSYKITVK